MRVKVGTSSPIGRLDEDTQKCKMTSQIANHKSIDNQRRHVTAVTQMILIMVVYISCFTPLILAINGIGTLTAYAYYINHVINFFIYLAVNKEFRKEVKVLMSKLLRKESSANVGSVFTL